MKRGESSEVWIDGTMYNGARLPQRLVLCMMAMQTLIDAKCAGIEDSDI